LNEIPTIIVDPLPPKSDRVYVVFNKPWAIMKWLQKDTIKEEYILMVEPGHVFVNPFPSLAQEDYPTTFPFSYINPNENSKVIWKFYPQR
jgi:hypothetical protein